MCVHCSRMKTQIVESNGSRVPGHSSFDETLAKFFARMSLLQRLEPVLLELFQIIADPDRPKGKETALPKYCYNILLMLRRTYFKALPVDAASRCASLDWGCLGQVIGAGVSSLQFGQSHLLDALAKEGLENLSEAEMTQLVRFVFPNSEEEKQSDLWPQIPGVTVQEMVANHFAIGTAELWEEINVCNQSAFHFGPDALVALQAGMAKGMSAFVGGDGQFLGETPRANIYWFLLLAWPEIRDFQESKPTKTRKDFNDWICPLAASGLVSISDFDQLLDVCDDVGLKFKGRGAPRKK
jgi:hypothetical protein